MRDAVRSGALPWFLLAGLGVACGERFEGAEAAGTGASGGSAGTGATAGTAGVGATAGTAGTGATAGTAGAGGGGTGGAAGTGGTAGSSACGGEGRIIYQEVNKQQASVASQLKSVCPDGSEPSVLDTSDTMGSEPSWHPDGERVVFVRSTAEGDSLILLPFAAPTQRQLLGQAPNSTRWEAPQFSPDGTKLVFLESADTRVTKLMLMDMEGGGGITRLTQSEQSVVEDRFTWLSNDQLVLGLGEPNARRLWLFNLTAGEFTQELAGGRHAFNPAATPQDPSTLLFVNQPDLSLNPRLLQLDLVTPGVSDVETNASMPCWAPHGERFAFIQSEGESLKGRVRIKAHGAPQELPIDVVAPESGGSIRLSASCWR